jgi:hypothetical protein
MFARQDSSNGLRSVTSCKCNPAISVDEHPYIYMCVSLAILIISPEMIILAKAVEAPIAVAEDHERHQLLRGLVDPGLERGALCRQGYTVGIGRVLEAAFVASGFEVHTQQAERLPALLQEDLGAPSDRPPIRGMDHAEARRIALADGVENATPGREALVDAIRTLLWIGIVGLLGHEMFDVAPRECTAARVIRM